MLGESKAPIATESILVARFPLMSRSEKNMQTSGRVLPDRPAIRMEHARFLRASEWTSPNGSIDPTNTTGFARLVNMKDNALAV